MDTRIEKWDFFELSFPGPSGGNPYSDVEVSAVFRNDNSTVEVQGFYDGDGVYRIRFMPDCPGEWNYATRSNAKELDDLAGKCTCVQSTAGNHGPVKVKDQFHFEYADGTEYRPFGTTCYAWIHQTEELQEQTLDVLSRNSFNKMRMCVFPKHYDYNHNEPDLYPFEGSLSIGFDFTRFNPAFFRHLERRILDLQKLGIECDLILFHPYDRWGFSDMGSENDTRYLNYIVSRLASIRSLWWSMANEYDLFFKADGSLAKDVDEWDRLATVVQVNDPYRHLQSIHNCFTIYEHGKPWITHCSIQRTDHAKTTENTNEWRALYGKPVVIDECEYEGNINHGWGNITGEEMTRRFWEGFLRGGYVTHGETYVHPRDILWWSHGGALHGSSPARIGFLRRILESAPGPISPLPCPAGVLFDPNWDVTAGCAGDDWRIYYFSASRPAFRVFDLPPANAYSIDILDTWAMTITRLEGSFSGKFRIELPSKQFMAILMLGM